MINFGLREFHPNKKINRRIIMSFILISLFTIMVENLICLVTIRMIFLSLFVLGLSIAYFSARIFILLFAGALRMLTFV